VSDEWSSGDPAAASSGGDEAERVDHRIGDLAHLLQRLADGGETDLSIWQLGSAAIDTIGRAAAPDERDAVAGWVQRLLRPLADRLGPEVSPGDDDRVRAVRGLVLGIRGVHGDPEATARAEEVFDRLCAGASVDAELGAGALRSVAASADEARFEAILDRFRHGDTPQEQVRFLYAAGTVADPGLFERYLELLSTGEVRSQNLSFAYRAALRNRHHGARGWAAVRDGWGSIRDRLPFNATHRMLEGIADQTDRALAEEIERFLADHPVPEASTLIAQHVERMWVQVALHEREAGRIAGSLPGG